MILIDTHAHLYTNEFDDDLERVIERAKTAGITTVLMPAIDAGTHKQMLSLEKNTLLPA